MSRIGDELATIVTAPMRGDLLLAIEQANGGGRGLQRQRTPDQLGRDRVVVAVKADVDGLVGTDWLEEIALKGMGRQREEPLLLKDLSDPARGVAGPGAQMSYAVAPLDRLAIEILECGEAAGRKE